MNIIYASCTSTTGKFVNLFGKSNNKPGQQVQKYHRLLLEGFAHLSTNKVKTVTALPINKNNTNKLFLNFEQEYENNIQYNYLPMINIPIFKNIFIFLTSFFYTIFLCEKNKESIIICDVLNISVSMGALFAAKIMKKKSIGIVTDLPMFLSSDNNRYVVEINNFILKRFDSYVFLTEQMNELVNKRNRPYVVIEGQVDINMNKIENNLHQKYGKKICIYAGGLNRAYGIDYLIEAFLKANISDSELHIYGNGDYENELKEICKSNKNVKYFGVVLNDIIVKEQLNATLLINPRLTNEEYTKYSFPSKNMEYMVSGTPVLTTNLPGMPKEYIDYVYLIEEESIDGLTHTLIEILSKPREILHEKGGKAKEFVLKEKNNVIQTEKIINMIVREL